MGLEVFRLRAQIVKPAIAFIAFGLTVATATSGHAFGGNRFGEGHQPKFDCPARTRVARFFMSLNRACENGATAAPNLMSTSGKPDREQKRPPAGPVNKIGRVGPDIPSSENVPS